MMIVREKYRFVFKLKLSNYVYYYLGITMDRFVLIHINIYTNFYLNL